MCAIAGIIDLDDYPVDSKELLQLLQVAKHRGPDGQGFFIEKNIGIGHNRLAIFDKSKDAAQPMAYKDCYQIVFNGAIYNFLELRTELIAKGYFFTSNSDTEVIVAAYDFWGNACVSHFNGMWAFAIYDRIKKTFFCSCDRFGVKPFYYAIQANKIYFASEIKQLLTVIQPKVNMQTVVDYLVYNLENHSAATFFENITRLEAGHSLLIDIQAKECKLAPYFKLVANNFESDYSQVALLQRFQQEAEEAVKLRVRGDVSIGLMLSGGLDSSFLFAKMKQQMAAKGATFSTITALSIDQKINEEKFARMVLLDKQATANSFFTKPTQTDFQNNLDEVFYCQEEPFSTPSVLMQYFVMQEAKKNNLKVLISGQGADEFLLGYERYLPLFLNTTNGTSSIKKWQQVLQETDLPLKELVALNWYFTNAAIRQKRLLKKHQGIKSSYLNLADSTLVFDMASDYQFPNRFPITEITNTHLPKLLRYEDRNSMHFGLESRTPFLDKDWSLFNFSLPLTSKIKHGQTKFLLREALRAEQLSAIANRKRKIGFAAPDKDWIADGKWMETTIQASKILKRLYQKPPQLSSDFHMNWKLYSIAKWEQIMNVSC